MTAQRNPGVMSVAEYLAGEEISEVKHEFLGGVVHAMAGATNRHNRIALNTLISLGTQLVAKSCQPFNSDTKVRLRFPDHTRFYYPDAMVVCGAAAGDRMRTASELRLSARHFPVPEEKPDRGWGR